MSETSGIDEPGEARPRDAPPRPERPTTLAKLRQYLGLNGLLIFKAAIVTIALAFILFIIDPLSSAEDDEEAVAAAWIGAIGRLGIEPIFPPQEDFHVGDIWAVVSRVDPSSQAVQPKTNETLVGRGIRIGHIDLKPDIAAMQPTPVFAETVVKTDGSLSLAQITYGEASPPTGQGVRLSLSSFPVIDIDRKASYSSSIMSYVGVSAGRNRNSGQHIAIPKVETYSAPAVEAFSRISNWCRSERYSLRCGDGFIRKLLSYTVDPRVLEVEKGAYTHTLQIQLVTQVYMTREIDVGSHVGGKLLVGLSNRDVPVAGAASGGSASVAEEASRDNIPGLAALDLDEANELKLGLRHIYQRPLVIGFKVISLEVPRSTPTQEESK